MATSTLRPLSLGEILDAGINVVIRNWKPLIGAQMLITAPLWALFVLLLASIDSSVFEFTPNEDPFASSSDISDATAIGFVITCVVLMLAFLVAWIALFKGVADALVGVEPRIGRSLKFGVRRAGWVFLLWLIWAPVVTIFALACGFPALWPATIWCLSIPAILFERPRPFKALGRSYNLVKGRFWASLLIVVVCSMLYWVVSNALSLPLLAVVAIAAGDNGIANAIVQGVGGLIGSAVIFPCIAGILTVLYFDQRVRKEGFDIQLLAEGGDRDPDAPLPAPLIPPDGWVPGPPAPQWGAAPEWGSQGGWAPPSAAHAPPLRWGPGADPRPASDSPWMTPLGAPEAPPPAEPPAEPVGPPPEAEPPAPWAPSGWSPPPPPEDEDESKPEPPGGP